MILKNGRKVASIRLEGDRDVVRARRKVSDIMKELGARPLMLTRFVTAVSEIARNAVTHGGGGTMDVYRFPADRKVGVCIQDAGLGIDDVEQALTDGFSTAGSMGRGLGGAQRLAVELEIEPATGGGTVVRMTGATQVHRR